MNQIPMFQRKTTNVYKLTYNLLILPFIIKKLRMKDYQMKRTKFSIVCFRLFNLSVFALAIGCGKTGSYNSSSGPALSYITIMNLAPYGDTTAVYFSGTKYSSVFAPDSYSGAYFKLASGNYDVQFKSNSSDSLLTSIPSSAYDSLGFYTLILYNDTSYGPLKSVKITDNFSNVNKDSAYFRFFNMSPDMPAIDLYINNIKVQANRTPADNIHKQLYNNFQSFSTGYYSIQVNQAGTSNIIGTAVSGNLQAGQVYTIFLEEQHTSSGNAFALVTLQGTD